MTMRLYRVLFPITLALTLVITSINTRLQAQAPVDDVNIDSLFAKATTLMEASKFAEALVPLERIFKEYGETGFDDFGPMFGVMFYRYGFCLKNLRRYDEALAAYTTSYQKGANTAGTPPEQRNSVWELSLLEIGVVKQAQGKYDEAIKAYEQFQARPPASGYDPTAFFVQVATCYTKSGNAAKGKAIMDQLFTGKTAVKPKPDGLFRGFLAQLDGWLAPGAVTPETERNIHTFIDANEAQMRVAPYDLARFGFNEKLMLLARTAADQNLNTLAVRLIGMMAPIGEILHDLKSRAARQGSNVTPALRAELVKYSDEIKKEDSADWVPLLVLANAYERLGNSSAGYAIYTQGAKDAPKSQHRPLMLFGSMRTALITGQREVAKKYGDQFLQEFPTHPMAGDVNTLMLENLFYSKRYDEALTLANKVRGPMKAASKERDLPDFVVAASLYNLGRDSEAGPELAAHAQAYPESRYREPVRFFEASTLVRTKDHEAAGPKLDAFIKDFPSSAYTPYALLSRATCHVALKQHQACLDIATRLIKDYPDFTDLGKVYSLAGDANYMLNHRAEAIAAYNQARTLSEAAGPEQAAEVARIIVQLIRVNVTEDKPDEVVKLYTDYMAKHKGSASDAEVIVSAIEPLKKLGRGKEALAEMEGVILQLGTDPGGQGLEQAIGSYIDLFGTVNSPEALVEKLTRFAPDSGRLSPTLEAWLLMARVNVLQAPANKDKFPKRDAQITVAFEDLQKFKKTELSPYILVQIGRYLATMNRPDTDIAAGTWFQAAIDRGPSEHYALGLMGRARLLAKSGDATTQKDAIAAFNQVIRELRDKPEFVEEAMLDKGRIFFTNKDWSAAVEVFLAMQQDTRFTKNRAEVLYRLGRSYEESAQPDKALDAYTPFVAPPLESLVEYSAEARVRATEIQIKKGNKAKAFRLAKDTVGRMYKLTNHPIGGPWIEKAKVIYKQLRNELDLPASQEEGLWGVK